MSSDALGGSLASEPFTAPADAALIRREWTDGIQTIHMDVDAMLRSVMVFDGKGTMDGARAVITLADSVRAELGPGKILAALVDMRRLDGAPLRSQFVLGKWLLSTRKTIDKVAMFGGSPFDMGLARAVMTIAGMGKKAHFGQRREDALAFLGWPNERHPR